MAVGTAVTVGGILALIGSNLSKVAEGAINIIKIVAAIGFGAVFASAIVNLLALVSGLVKCNVRNPPKKGCIDVMQPFSIC